MAFETFLTHEQHRPKQRRRVTPAGLAAFEDAPCFRELVELEERTPQ
jgi:hypothetical protein